MALVTKAAAVVTTLAIVGILAGCRANDPKLMPNADEGVTAHDAFNQFNLPAPDQNLVVRWGRFSWMDSDLSAWLRGPCRSVASYADQAGVETRQLTRSVSETVTIQAQTARWPLQESARGGAMNRNAIRTFVAFQQRDGACDLFLFATNSQ